MTTDLITDYLIDTGPELVERINLDFADAVLMVAQHLSGFPDATSVTVTSIDATGVDVVVTDPAGEHPARADFAVTVETPDDLGTALIEMLGRARDASGEEGMTTAEREA